MTIGSYLPEPTTSPGSDSGSRGKDVKLLKRGGPPPGFPGSNTIDFSTNDVEFRKVDSMDVKMDWSENDILFKMGQKNNFILHNLKKNNGESLYYYGRNSEQSISSTTESYDDHLYLKQAGYNNLQASGDHRPLDDNDREYQQGTREEVPYQDESSVNEQDSSPKYYVENGTTYFLSDKGGKSSNETLNRINLSDDLSNDDQKHEAPEEERDTNFEYKHEHTSNGSFVDFLLCRIGFLAVDVDSLDRRYSHDEELNRIVENIIIDELDSRSIACT